MVNGGRELLSGETSQLAEPKSVFVNVINDVRNITMARKQAMLDNTRGVTTLVVTSGEMLQRALVADSFEWYREHWLLRCRLLVVSERLA